MNRRVLLVAVGAGAFAGCVRGEPNDGSHERTPTNESADTESAGHDGDETDRRPDPDFDQCSAPAVSFFLLPDPVQKEMTTALEDGAYEAEELWYPSAVTGSTRVRKDGTYYLAEIEPTDDGERLTFEVSPPTTTGYTYSLHNDTDDDLEVTVTVDDGENILTDETVIVEPTADLDGDDPTIGVPESGGALEYGTYEFTGKIGGEVVETEAISVTAEAELGGWIDLEADEASVTPEEIAMHHCVEEFG